MLRKTLLLILFSLCSNAFASERIHSFHSDITVQRDGSVDVVETIRVQAEGNQIKRGIYRNLPTSYVHPKLGKFGFRSKAPITVVSVQRDGAEEAWHSEELDNGIRIYIGDLYHQLSRGEYTYKLRYRAERQVAVLPNNMQMTWNVTGNNWLFPIDEATAIVHLPGDADATEQFVYTGPQGSRASDAKISGGDGSASSFKATRMLSAQEGMTVRVRFSSPEMVPPQTDDWQALYRDNRALVWGYSLLLLMPILMLLLWLWNGVDPAKGTIVARYRPIDKLSAAAHRAVFKNIVDNTSFAVAILSAAIKGWLNIEKISDNVYRFVRTDKTNKKVLSPSEKILVDGFFTDGDSIDIGAEYNEAVSKSKGVFERFLEKEFASKAHQNHIFFLFLGAIVGVIGIVLVCINLPESQLKLLGIAAFPAMIGAFLLSLGLGAIKGPDNLGFGFIALVIAVTFYFFGEQWLALPFGLFGLVMVVFIYLMPAATEAGRKLLDKIEGFRLYLSKAEHDSLKRLKLPTKTPQLYEEMLPFALALDLETEWSDQFASVLAAARESGEYSDAHYHGSWYQGGDSGSVGSFAPALAAGLASSVVAASTPPSSSSGGSGGGFSGGGGGGGGGGGW